MPLTFVGDTDATRSLTCAARFSEDEGPEIGTAHVLAAMQLVVPRVKKLLDAFDITQPVLHTGYTKRAEPWAPDDQVPDEVTVSGADTALVLSAGLTKALTRCMELPGTEPRSPEALLTAILQDEDSRAAVVLRECGTDLDQLRQALSTGQAPQPADRVPAGLRTTRDTLLGRKVYRGRGLRGLLSSLLPIRLNWALAPVMWATLEADEIAKRRGGATRTDDILVAMLATYEVTLAYPHLSRSVPEQYDGVAALVAAGLDHRAAAEASAALDPAGDAVPPKRLIQRGESYPRNTQELLDRLLAHEDNRSARLLRAAGIRKTQASTS
ncbi:MAG: Clp protease N-terminal domain-containing protein [Actinoplanes sp.]